MKNVISLQKMNASGRNLPSGRPPKRRRTDAELQALATVLGADWTPGDTVQTWINKHEGKTGELSRLVEEGWSWEDIGKAMHLAGIFYSTGQQIPPHTLRLKAHLSRKREKLRASARDASAQPATVLGRTTFDSSDAAERQAAAEPTFRLVTLKAGQQPLQPQPPLPHPPPEEIPAAKVSDEDILRQVFGKY